jgi:hypothetical protein
MSVRFHPLLGTLIMSGLGVTAIHAECPPPEEVLARLDALPLSHAARTREFYLSPPRTLYQKAAAKPDKVMVKSNGELGLAVMLAKQPVASLWMAVNDEDHYARDGYLPVLHSEVIGGTSRGPERILFQYFKQAGVGRWWVDEVVMSNQLFIESHAMLWELRWRDLMETYDEQSLPPDLARQMTDLDLSPIRASRGAWLMIPIEPDCTLIEYVTHSDPGGLLNLAQWLGAGRVIRDTLEGVQRLALEHIPEPHPEARFVRPDGSLLASAEE